MILCLIWFWDLLMNNYRIMKIKLMTSATLSSYLNELLYLYEICIQPNCIVNILAVIMNNPAFTIFVNHQCLFMKKTFFIFTTITINIYQLKIMILMLFTNLILSEWCYIYQTDQQYNKCDYNLVLRIINCVCLTISIFINFNLYIL